MKIILLGIFIFPALLFSQSQIRVMTFNIKGDDATAGSQFNAAQSWVYLGGLQPGRRERALSVIHLFNPDILGVQELKNNQMADILNEFPDFSYFGEGRDGGNNGDRNGVFFRSSRFSRTDGGSFWLSTTPTIPGTTFQGGGTDTGNPRMATWMKLHDNSDNKDFFILCTHWSLDPAARLLSASLIRDSIIALHGNLPVLVLGDLNDVKSSNPFRELSGFNDFLEIQLTDAYAEVNISSTFERTYHNWGAYGTSGSRIDFILYSQNEFDTDSAAIIRWTDPSGGYFPSDHYPVGAVIHSTTPINRENEFSTRKIEIFPNPANDFCWIRKAGIESMTCEIFDLQGRILCSKIDSGELMRIDLAGLGTGIYLLKVDGKYNFKLAVE